MSDSIIEKNMPVSTGLKRLRALWQIAKYAFVAFCIVVPIRLFIAQPFVVSGASMFPTFSPGEYLVIDELTYRHEKPQRGDVIVFKYPLDPSIYFIKRVIGLPGEVVNITNGIVRITDTTHKKFTVLAEPYRTSLPRKNDTSTTTLAGGEYFVLGDNRNASADSRVWGPLQSRFIVGRAIMRLYPFANATIFPGKFDFSN